MLKSDEKISAESLGDSMLIGEVVSIDGDFTKKFGEAQVRVEALHGDASITKDEDLPVALYYNKSYPEAFGTYDVGDLVLVRFMSGDITAPIIEGKVFNLDDVTSAIPEYASSYGQVKGIYSKKLKASFFFNEADGTIVQRFLDGSQAVMTKDSWHIKLSQTVSLEVEDYVADVRSESHTTTGSNYSVDSGGDTFLRSAGRTDIEGNYIKVNSRSAVIIVGTSCDIEVTGTANIRAATATINATGVIRFNAPMIYEN